MKPKTKCGLEIYQMFSRQWRWRVRSRNGLIIAASTESYSRRRSVMNNLRAIVNALDTYHP